MLTLNLKTVSAHLNGQNPKYPPWMLHPRLPTLMVKTLSTHLKSQPKTQTAHLKGQNPKCPPQWSKL